MADHNLVGSFIGLQANPTDDNTMAATALAPFEDYSRTVLTGDPFGMSGDAPRGGSSLGQPIGRVFAGGKSGSGSLSFRYNPGGSPDAAAFFRAVFASATRRFRIIHQPNRAGLIASDGDPVIPAATAANPQIISSAILTSYAPFSTDGATAAGVAVSFEWDSDWAEYDS